MEGKARQVPVYDRAELAAGFYRLGPADFVDLLATTVGRTWAGR